MDDLDMRLEQPKTAEAVIGSPTATSVGDPTQYMAIKDQDGVLIGYIPLFADWWS